MVGLSNLGLLKLLLVISLFLFLISLFLVVDLLEVELVQSIFLVLEVSEEGHCEDPYVCEDEESHEKPH